MARQSSRLFTAAVLGTHTSNFGVKLQEHLRSCGLKSELVYPGAPYVKHASIEGYLIDRLTSDNG